MYQRPRKSRQGQQLRLFTGTACVRIKSEIVKLLVSFPCQMVAIGDDDFSLHVLHSDNL